MSSMAGVVVIVLGDLGRSPRMQYHASSLAAVEAVEHVTLVGYEGETCMPASYPAIQHKLHERRISLSSLSLAARSLPAPVTRLLKALSLVFHLLSILGSTRFNLAIVQNPPCLPVLLALVLLQPRTRLALLLSTATLALQHYHRASGGSDASLVMHILSLAAVFIVSFVASFNLLTPLLPRARVILDWHNLGFSMFTPAPAKAASASDGGKVEEREPGQPRGRTQWVLMMLEVLAVRVSVDRHVAVSEAMRAWVLRHCGGSSKSSAISSSLDDLVTLLYDRPALAFSVAGEEAVMLRASAEADTRTTSPFQQAASRRHALLAKLQLNDGLLPKVAFLGPPGTYSDSAAATFLSLGDLTRQQGRQQQQQQQQEVSTNITGSRGLPCASFRCALEALSRGLVSHAVIPVSNTTSGAVRDAQECLREYAGTNGDSDSSIPSPSGPAPLRVLSRFSMPVQHYLLAPVGTRLRDVSTIYGHREALAQCKGWLGGGEGQGRGRELGLRADFQTVAVSSNAEGARLVRDQAGSSTSGGLRRGEACIASLDAAKLYSLAPVMDCPFSIQDEENNATTFAVLCRANDGEGGENALALSTIQTVVSDGVVTMRPFPQDQPERLPRAESTTAARPLVLVSSTSWTDDEDFPMLLRALTRLDAWLDQCFTASVGGKSDKSKSEQEADASASASVGGTRVVLLITGKGPLKAQFASDLSSLWAAGKGLRWVSIRLLWLDLGDYPSLLASADCGVSMHSSTSGLDLPMKVLDMYGVALPVLSYRFAAIGELVKAECGVLFGSEEELLGVLRRVVRAWASQGGGELAAMRAAVEAAWLGSASQSDTRATLQQGKKQKQQTGWDENWQRCMQPVVLRCLGSP